MDIGNAFEDAVNTAVNIVPRLIAFLLILIIGYIVARILASVLNKILERVGFDRAVERGGVGRALAPASTTPPTSWPSSCSTR